MKKNFLYSFMALCICLFAACSQEEIIPEASQSGKTVNMIVGVPGGATTRAIPSVDGKILRCIMQIVDANNAPIAGEGMRQALKVETDKVTFTFKAPEGDYKCVFWADFVADVNTDNIYTTTDLTNITYKATGNDVFSAAADAYCGYVANGSTTIQLKRPFAKVSVTPNSASNYAAYNKLTVSYDAPSGFNIVTKAVSSTSKKVTYTNTAFEAAKGAWFTSYIFAASNMSKLNSDITMNLEGASGVEAKTLTVEANKVPLTENYEINGKFDAAEGNNVNVEVGFDNEFDKPGTKAPVVGDYFYADGTWGAAISNGNGSPAVGVVFHVESTNNQLDNVANYTGVTFTDNQIRGWVVSLTQSAKTVWGNSTYTMTQKIAGIGSANNDKGDYKGYANSQIIAQEEHKAAYDLCATWPVKPNSDVAATSWYLPAVGQLSVLKDNIDAVNTSLAKLTDAQNIPLDKALTNHWTSTHFEDEANGIKFYQLQYDATTSTFKFRSELPKNNAGVVRPVLTF